MSSISADPQHLVSSLHCLADDDERRELLTSKAEIIQRWYRGLKIRIFDINAKCTIFIGNSSSGKSIASERLRANIIEAGKTCKIFKELTTNTPTSLKDSVDFELYESSTTKIDEKLMEKCDQLILCGELYSEAYAPLRDHPLMKRLLDKLFNNRLLGSLQMNTIVNRSIAYHYTLISLKRKGIIQLQVIKTEDQSIEWSAFEVDPQEGFTFFTGTKDPWGV